MRNHRSGVRRMALVVVAAIMITACAVGDTGAARYVADESATFQGLLHSTQTGPTRFWFEYGATTDYGSSTVPAVIDVVAGTPTAVSRAVEGLQPGATYHYRLCAVDDDADPQGICGADRSFTTGVGRESVSGEGTIEGNPRYFGPTSGSVTAAADPDGTGYLDGDASIAGSNIYWDPSTPWIPPVTTPWGGAGAVTCLRVSGNVATVGFHYSDSEIAVLVIEDNGPTNDRMDVIPLDPGEPCPTPDPALLGTGWAPFGFTTLAFGDFVVKDD